MTRRPRTLSRSSALAVLTALLLVDGASAQGRLVGARSSSATFVYESWSFADPVPQPTLSGDATVLLDHVSEFSIPLSFTLPVGQAWSVGMSAAYSSGRVVLSAADPESGTTAYTLTGLTDVRVRATGRLSSGVALTLGLNAPSGKTSLSAEEYSAFRVLAAPTLGFQVARLGNGVSGTAGVVLSRPLNSGWAGAVGLSYEMRGGYQPGELPGVLSSPDYNPGDAIRFSVGLDGLVGQSGMTLGLSADLYPGQDEIRDPAFQGSTLTTQLGPVLTADWQLRVARHGFRELTLYALDRYRTSYRIGSSDLGSSTVPQSHGNYLDLGVRAVVSVNPRAGILVSPNFRHQTGLKSDNTVATAGIVSGTLTVGLIRSLGSYSLQPFVRGQVGRLKTGDESTAATGLAAGVAFTARF